jgi:DNA anti-recombination protein RmuC
MRSEADAPEPTGQRTRPPEQNALVDVRAQAAALRSVLERLHGIEDSVAAHSAHDLTRMLADRDRRQDELQVEADARLRVIAEQAEHIRNLEKQLEALAEAADQRLTLLEANHRSHAAFRKTVRERLRDLLDAIPE